MSSSTSFSSFNTPMAGRPSSSDVVRQRKNAPTFDLPEIPYIDPTHKNGPSFSEIENQPPLNLPRPHGGFTMLCVIPASMWKDPEIPQLRETPFDIEIDEGSLMPIFTINVSSSDDDDVGVTYYLRCNETFERVYNDYARRCDRFVNQLMITKMGETIPEHETPMGLRLNHVERLIARSENLSYNLNTHVKQFYVREHLTSPFRVKVKGALHAQLRGIFDLWALHRELDPQRLVMSCENRVLTRYQTVEAAKIRNEDDVLVLPNV